MFYEMTQYHDPEDDKLEVAKIINMCFGNYGKKNSVALVHEQTIPTERPPHVCEVSTNFCG
jgi:hypothetical protein